MLAHKSELALPDTPAIRGKSLSSNQSTIANQAYYSNKAPLLGSNKEPHSPIRSWQPLTKHKKNEVCKTEPSFEQISTLAICQKQRRADQPWQNKKLFSLGLSSEQIQLSRYSVGKKRPQSENDFHINSKHTNKNSHSQHAPNSNRNSKPKPNSYQQYELMPMPMLHRVNMARDNKVSYTCVQDYFSLSHAGNRHYNEDRIAVSTDLLYKMDKCHLFAVFDGHGGSATADFLSKNLASYISESLHKQPKMSLLEALKLSLSDCEDKISKSSLSVKKSGSCVTAAIVHQKTIYVANIGDSRILAVHTKQPFDIKQLTTDHKPDNPAEKKRIEANGGRVYRNISNNDSSSSSTACNPPSRVYPGKISVSRTIGDFLIKKEAGSNVISSEPELVQVEATPGSFLLLLSDGVYEKMDNFDIARHFKKSSCPIQAVRNLFDECEQRNSEDNRTIIAVKIK